MNRTYLSLLAMAVAASLSACGTPATGTSAPAPTEAAMMEKPTEAAMMEKPTEAAMMEKPTEAALMEKPTEAVAPAQNLAAWQTLPLVNAATGESFTLADFAGRPVYVETMATWCHNCRQQLATVQQLIASQPAGEPVFVALSVETDLPATTLAQYAADNGFAMVFAVVSPDMLRALTGTFGRTITNPPSTPHFVIAPDGSAGELLTGFSTADEIAARIAGS